MNQRVVIVGFALANLCEKLDVVLCTFSSLLEAFCKHELILYKLATSE